jgi:hypothetical protein
LLATDSIDNHLILLKDILNTLAKNHVQLRIEKCQFLKTEIEFLGYKISFNRILPSDKHLKSIQSYPVPHDIRSLQRFIGFVSYFRKFILNFNKIASSLYEILKNKSEFKFESKHLSAFNELRENLLSKPVLAIYSPFLETQLHTDVSSGGFGAILLQRQLDDRLFHPVSFFSRKTTEAESRLHSFELEVLAVVFRSARI